MTKKKPAPIVGLQREKLLVALQMHDMVGAINLAMRVRKLRFTLDYIKDHFPRLWVEMPGCEPEVFMTLDPRKHACYITPPRQKDLFFAMTDMTERLHKLGGRMSLTGDKPAHGPRRALLQIYVDGAKTIALTLADTTKGHSVTDTDFQLPDGTIP